MERPIVAVHAKVYGRVQGVGFRYSAKRLAQRYSVTGWVRNNFDDTVEVVCEGEKAKVTAFLQWLEKGPPGAYVSKVITREYSLQGFEHFSIEY